MCIRDSHQRARRYTALLLALALTTGLFVNWQLHGVGIAKTADYLCGELEHEHTAACYEKQLVCGYEEGDPEDWNATMTDDGMSFDDTFDMDDDAFGVDADDPGIAAHSAEPEYILSLIHIWCRCHRCAHAACRPVPVLGQPALFPHRSPAPGRE